MATARKRLIDPKTTPFYHCISRCVRRSFLCGECHLTGKNYEHRKAWVTSRLAKLSRVFAIDIASYAIMSNHYHLVLRLDIEKAKNLTFDDIIGRWGQVFSIPKTVKLAQEAHAPNSIVDAAHTIVDTWRDRLCSVSWFMRCLNEYLARRANKEDECTGRFWEGRFKSQALLDEAAVITAMAYTDLNPVRANIAKTIEESKYTSIHQRENNTLRQTKCHSIKLMPLTRQSFETQSPIEVNISQASYASLIRWGAEALTNKNSKTLSKTTQDTLEQLNLLPNGFIKCMKKKDDIKGLRVIGNPVSIKRFLEKTDSQFLKGSNFCRQLYRSS